VLSYLSFTVPFNYGVY